MSVIEQKPWLCPEETEIFNVIQKNGPLTKNQIAALTGFKLTSLLQYMRHLERSYLIAEAQVGESTGGRKPLLYDVTTDRYYIIGIEISRIYAQLVLVNLKMQVVQKVRFPMDEASTPDAIVDKIEAVTGQFYSENHITPEMILGLGVGTVGPLDLARGIVLSPANFTAPGWRNVPLKALLENRFGIEAYIENGANAAALGEHYYGVGKNCKNILYLNCGMGIRTSVISSGKLIRTINDAEDAFGHMVINVDGKQCRCGNNGCIESYSTIYAMTEAVRARRAEKTAGDGLSQAQMTFEEISRLAEAGEPLTRRVLDEGAEILGIGLSNLIHLLNPSLVILSGQLISQSARFYDICTKVAADRCGGDRNKTIVFSRGGLLEENAISIGSAALVLEQLLGSPLIY